MAIRFRPEPKKAQYIKDVQKDYLEFEAPMMRVPVPPICVVTSTHIALSENSRAVRNFILIPCFLALCCLCFVHVGGALGLSIKSQTSDVEVLMEKKIRYQGKDFLETDTINDIGVYYSVDPEASFSLKHFRLMAEQNVELPFLPKYVKINYYDLVLFVTYLAVIPILLLKIVLFRRRAPLYFDRERRIVYTWLSGQVWVQRYDQLQFLSSNRSLQFLLYSEDASLNPSVMAFTLQPSGSLWFNGDVYYRPLFSAICQFMEKGIDAVWWHDWSGIPGYFLLGDKMPPDLYEQVGRVFERLSDGR